MVIRLAYNGILDHSKVTVKPFFLQSFDMADIRHYEAVRRELVRLLRDERIRRKLSNYAVSQRSGVSGIHAQPG